MNKRITYVTYVTRVEYGPDQNRHDQDTGNNGNSLIDY